MTTFHDDLRGDDTRRKWDCLVPWGCAIKKCTNPSNMNPKVLHLQGFPEANLTEILGSTFTYTQTVVGADEVHRSALCELIQATCQKDHQGRENKSKTENSWNTEGRNSFKGSAQGEAGSMGASMIPGSRNPKRSSDGGTELAIPLYLVPVTFVKDPLFRSYPPQGKQHQKGKQERFQNRVTGRTESWKALLRERWEDIFS